MSVKTDQAIAKITEEALKINNNFSVFIEEHLTAICTNDRIADKLLNSDKTLADFCHSCESEARERARKQGSGFQINGLPDAEYQEMVEKYYGIAETDKGLRPAAEGKVFDIMDFGGVRCDTFTKNRKRHRSK